MQVLSVPFVEREQAEAPGPVANRCVPQGMGCKFSALRGSLHQPQRRDVAQQVEPAVWNRKVVSANLTVPIGVLAVSGILQEPCLILNRNWQPITFLPVQTAIVNVMRDMASVLDVQDYLLLTFEEWVELGRSSDCMIQTPSLQIAAPEVVVLKKYGERPPRKVVFNRPNLWKRDQFTCQYCGVALPGEDLTIEHVTPRSRAVRRPGRTASRPARTATAGRPTRPRARPA